MGAIEVRPEGFGEIEFGIGRLPREKITEAQFLAGADEQIRVRDVGGGEVLGDRGFGDVGDVELALLNKMSDALAGLGDFGATAIVDSDLEVDTLMILGEVVSVVDRAFESFGKGG